MDRLYLDSGQRVQVFRHVAPVEGHLGVYSLVVGEVEISGMTIGTVRQVYDGLGRVLADVNTVKVDR